MHSTLLLLLVSTLGLINAAPLYEESIPSPNALADRGNDDTNKSPSLAARAPAGSQSNPKDVLLDCSNNIDWVCNIDCFAILCAGKPQVLQRDGANKRKRYAASGAAATPFNQSPAWMAAHGGLTRLGADYVSAEEYPFESAAQGGKGAVVAGAPILMQRRQGGALNTAFSRGYPDAVQQLEWYNIKFDSKARYCTALSTRDKSVCTARLPEPDDPKNYAFVRVSGMSRSTIQYRRWNQVGATTSIATSTPADTAATSSDTTATAKHRRTTMDADTSALVYRATDGAVDGTTNDPNAADAGLEGYVVPSNESDDDMVYLEEPAGDFYVESEIGGVGASSAVADEGTVGVADEGTVGVA